MNLITDTNTLASFCGRLACAPFVAVDTEFIREKTYWSQVCLVQIAGAKEACCIDPLAPGLDLNPLCGLMANRRVLKIFHAARQDIEILLEMTGAIPTPLFDTQVAAMVCGFGDSVGYETLVNKLTKAHIDKSVRFTDWSQRPLLARQIQYALADVTHLTTIYEHLRLRLEREGRLSWLEEEMATLTDPATYRVDPCEAWRRLKPRSSSPRFLAVLRELAAWRETEAQNRNLPRQRILRDEALVEVAAITPGTLAELGRARLLPRSSAEGRRGEEILDAVTRGAVLSIDQCPVLPERTPLPNGMAAVVDLLRVLLKMKCDQHDVAQKLVASTEDLEKIAIDDNANVPALQGWRREVFGIDALRVKHGTVALAFSAPERRVKLVSASWKD